NVFDGLITVVSSKLIAQTGNGGSLPSTAWFLMDTGVSKLKFVRRLAMGSYQATDANTGNKSFYARSRFCVGWADWRGIWGSKGDGAAYSA
ncbi:MAG: hypothetical protein KGL39_43925, partial [Patescibacteria group bacterium]|nr:hypothetical protein [Patescibacteria group bacterium]